MFEFMKKQNYENKKEYKRRVNQRGTEILEGINCTDDERINLKALVKCQAHFMLLHGKFIGIDLNQDEYDLKKGNAKDYEKYLEAVFFNHLNLKEFETEKAKLWDELFYKYISSDVYWRTNIEDELEKKLDQDDEYLSKYQGMTYSKKAKVSRC